MTPTEPTIEVRADTTQATEALEQVSEQFQSASDPTVQVTDPGIVRIVALGLVALAILIAGGLLAVAIWAVDLPIDTRTQAVTLCGSMGTGAFGAAAALLSSTRSRLR